MNESNDSAKCDAIGVDIGGTKTLVTTYHHGKHSVLLHTETDTENPDKTLREIQAVLKKHTVPVGVGVPGPLNDTIVGYPNHPSPNLGAWNGVDIAQALPDADIILHDLTAAAIGVQEKHDVQNAILVMPGTGFGCTAILNGQPHQGSYGVSGEVADIAFEGDTVDTSLSLQGLKKLLPQNIDLEQALQKNSPGVRRYAEALSRFLETPLRFLNPDAVVLCGHLAEYQGIRSVFQEALQDKSISPLEIIFEPSFVVARGAYLAALHKSTS